MADERWSPRDCHLFFENRDWDPVVKFYELVVRGEASLSDLKIDGQESGAPRDQHRESEGVEKNNTKQNNEVLAREEGRRWERRTFKIVLRYSGAAFNGWQKQPGFVTVQSLLEKALGKFVDGKRARLLEEQGKAKEALVSVAGRTDKGVHASGQVCSFYTWMRDCKAEDVESVVNSVMPTALKAVSASEVDRDFHPIFSAKWRRYVYIFPMNSRGEINVAKVSKLLQALEGSSLCYKIFARDTKVARSSGPATFCTVHHARAAVAELLSPEATVMVVELVADRFLRKMVRVLVSTVIREVVAGASDDALISLMTETSRRASAPPAPPDGLCLVEVGYQDMNISTFLIS